MPIHYSHCPVCSSPKIAASRSICDYSVSKKVFPVWSCNDCSHLFTQDVPAQNEIGPYYASEAYISHSDTKEGFFNKAYHYARDLMLDKKRGLLEARHSGSGQLLDIGSGTGYFMNCMQQAGWQTLGIEADPGARKYSQEKFELDVQDVDKLDEIPADSKNAVSMWHVLEHVHELQHYMQRIHQILKADGSFFVAVPNCTSSDAVHYETEWAGWDVPRHLYHFTPDSMQRLAEINQFEIVERKGMPFDPFYVSMLSERYKGNSLGAVRGIIRGIQSFLRAQSNVEQSSSIIYIMKKKHSSS